MRLPLEFVRLFRNNAFVTQRHKRAEYVFLRELAPLRESFALVFGIKINSISDLR
jgi:hypothetical protein